MTAHSSSVDGCPRIVALAASRWFATALGSSLAFLDTTVAAVALPSMEEDLGLSLAGQQWVYLAYALTLSVLYLVSGAVGDRLGLRRTFVVGVVLFAGASLLCAVAPTGGMLIGGRALQGVGGAVLTTTSLALLRVRRRSARRQRSWQGSRRASTRRPRVSAASCRSPRWEHSQGLCSPPQAETVRRRSTRVFPAATVTQASMLFTPCWQGS